MELPYNRTGEESGFKEGITRSQYWFDDGDVIIQVENTQFRVHTNTLCESSTIFKSAFSNICDSYRPLGIRLTDKAGDFECLMSIFYEDSTAWRENDAMPFEQCAALLRLGKKYDIEYLFENALRRFRNVFPDTLSGWYEHDMRRLSSEGIELDLNRDPFVYERAMALANELSLNRVLPAICLTLMKAKDTNGILNSLEKHSPTEDACCFAPHLLRNCMKGRNAISCRLKQRVQEWVDRPGLSPIPSQACARTKSCFSNGARSIVTINSGAYQSSRPSITIFWDDACSRLSKVGDLICWDCKKSVMHAIRLLGEELWSDLPAILGIGDCWEDLEDFDS